jgi:hypothetical protein
MKYLKKFNEHQISIFDQAWKTLLPDKLNIITSTGDWELKKKDVIINNNLIQITYYQNTVDKSGSVTSDGEPDYLCFDIHLTKNNTGETANPDKLKLLVDITYGDAMVSEFTIEAPNKINVVHYTSIGSKYDPKTMFAFTDDSIGDLINFLNRMSPNYKLTYTDFNFLDSDPKSYTPNY